MTVYRGEAAEKAMTAGLAVFWDHHEIVADVVACALGYMSWRQYTDFNSQEVHVWNNLQLKYEILYYLWRTGADFKQKAKLVHHMMCLGYLYFGWDFKTALSTAFFFASTSNCFLGLVQKYPNNATKISFAISFFISRIIYGTWIMKSITKLPVSGSSVAVVPMTGTVYMLNLWWARKIAVKVLNAIRSNGSQAA